MKSRECPKCHNNIELLMFLTFTPNKSFSCVNCTTQLAVTNSLGCRLFMYGGLAIVLPTFLYLLVEPNFNISVLLGIEVITWFLSSIYFQKVTGIKT